MNIALWIAAGLLAAAFLVAGLTKLTQPKDALKSRMPWVEDFSASQVKAIGATEVAGALGLILPAVTGIAPALVPIAATGLAINMVVAAVVHMRRGEVQIVPVNLVLLALAVFVAWGRFGSHAF